MCMIFILRLRLQGNPHLVMLVLVMLHRSHILLWGFLDIWIQIWRHLLVNRHFLSFIIYLFCGIQYHLICRLRFLFLAVFFQYSNLIVDAADTILFFNLFLKLFLALLDVKFVMQLELPDITVLILLFSQFNLTELFSCRSQVFYDRRFYSHVCGMLLQINALILTV